MGDSRKVPQVTEESVDQYEREEPTNLTDFHRQLASRHDALSRRLQQVSRYVQGHPQSIALDTLAVIAARAGVHPSTLVRFSHALGFDGFSALQKLFKDHLQQHYTDYGARIRQRMLAAGQKRPTSSNLLAELTEAQRQSLDTLERDLEPALLERAVDLLQAATRVHLCAVRRAFPVALSMHYTLSHMGVLCHLIDGIGLMHREQAASLATGDVLVATTFHPYAQSIRELIATASNNGCAVLLLTDRLDAPSVAHADCVLAVQDASVRGFRSLDASLCVAQAMCLALGYRREQQDQLPDTPSL